LTATDNCFYREHPDEPRQNIHAQGASGDIIGATVIYTQIIGAQIVGASSVDVRIIDAQIESPT
jgi:hypothetical protein